MANPQIPILLEMRSELESELEKLRDRIEKIQAYIRALDSTITAGSFTTADTALAVKTDTPEEPSRAPADGIDELRSVILMNKERDLELATMEITQQEIRCIPAAHAVYDIKRGAFARFFVQNILGKYQEEDRLKIESGGLTWDEAFEFDIRAEDGILEELIIKNYGTDDRLSEIERTLRWSLEKIYRAR
jgi:hypothetical protein